jgi:hypothetical protein
LSVVSPDEEQGTAKRPGLDRIAALAIFLSLLVFTVALMFLSIPLGIWTVFYGHLSHLIDYATIARPYFWIGPLVAYSPFTVSLGDWFLISTAIYVLLIGYSVVQTRRPLEAVKASYREGISALFASPFLATVIAVGFLVFSSIVLDAIISSSGTPIGGPSSLDDPLGLLMGFTTSPIIEELGFRVLLIGVVALILSMRRPLKDALVALWRPSKALEGLALGSGASILIWVATGFSAITFGACHVVCGSGTWDIGKFPEAAFGGLVLGVVYVKYGFHVAVLVHWGVDYFGEVYSFYGQAAFGIPWNSATREYIGQYLVDIDMLLLFGFASFLVVTYVVVRKAVSWRRSRGSVELDKGLIDEGKLAV